MEEAGTGRANKPRLTKLELLDKKLSLVLRIRDLTASADLSGDNAEECYIALISQREAIVKQLKALDSSLSEYEPEEGEEKLLALIRTASAQVLEIDNQLAARVPELLKGIKNHLKQIKDGRNLNRAYHTDVLGIMGGRSYGLKK